MLLKEKDITFPYQFSQDMSNIRSWDLPKAWKAELLVCDAKFSDIGIVRCYPVLPFISSKKSKKNKINKKNINKFLQLIFWSHLYMCVRASEQRCTWVSHTTIKSPCAIFRFLKLNYIQEFGKKWGLSLDFLGAPASSTAVKRPVSRLAMKIIMPISF